ncbi:MAG: FHA domain-containing protein [Clostridiales bacterium]|nr:FHA domain-containing protein [Clostridiales bacterium]
MGGKIKYAAGLLLLLLLLTGAAGNVQAADGDGTFTISQADIYMPDMTVYLDFDDDTEINASDITAQIKDADMTLMPLSVESMSDTEKGISYYVLLDISTSISESQFEVMKEEIVQLQEKLRDQDSMEVITFGKEVTVVLEGGESRKEVENTLDGIIQEKGTHLYAGMDLLVSEAEEDRKQEISSGTDSMDFQRRVGIVLTDWQEVKDEGGVTSQEESLQSLQQAGIPLYGFCPKTVKSSMQDDMGLFLRKTGGDFSLLSENSADKALVKLNKSLLQEKVVYIESSSNRTYESEKVLEVTVGEYTAKTEHVYLSSSRADETAPEIINVEQAGEDAKTLLVTFSEDVKNADNKGNYSIRRGGKTIYTVSEATYTATDGEYKATLVLNDALVKGNYEVSTYNITDNTNEENLLSTSWSGQLEGEGMIKAIYHRLGRYWAVILAIAVLLIIFIIYRVIKRNNGILYKEDKMVLGSNMGKKEHIKHNASSTKEVVLLISGIAAETRRMNVQINGSAIIGRSSICDIYFDDLSMSKQHFALEVEQGELYVTDLNSSNGTLLDGRPVYQQRMRVNNGSRIEAGSVTLVIRW